MALIEHFTMGNISGPTLLGTEGNFNGIIAGATASTESPANREFSLRFIDNDIVTIPQAIVPSNKMGIAIWEFSTVSTPNPQGLICVDSGNISNFTFRRHTGGSNYSWRIGNNESFTPNVPRGQWNLNIINVDEVAGTTELYTNDMTTPFDTQVLIASFSAFQGAMTLGNRPSLDTDFDGNIGDVWVFDGPIDLATRLSLLNNPSPPPPPPTFEQVFFDFLKTNVPELLNRIHHVDAPQDEPLPYMIYQRISAPRTLVHGAAQSVVDSRFQIDIWGSSDVAVLDIAATLRNALNAFRGNMGSIFVHVARLDREDDEFENQTRLHRRSTDYLIKYEED